jgi:uncharacterized protein YajQ (UPF0234 family)
LARRAPPTHAGSRYEVTNALDQARREIETRNDLKGSKNEVRLEKNVITVLAADDMKLTNYRSV